jgi:hypothetical protein
LIDPLEEELPPSLPTNNRWQMDGQEATESHTSFTNRLPRVNFDLDSVGGSSVVSESTTHTDTEGSDCGNGGGSDSSASLNRRSHNPSSSSSSSRRRQPNGQTTIKKRQNESMEPMITSTPSAPAQSQPQPPQASPPPTPLQPSIQPAQLAQSTLPQVL